MDKKKILIILTLCLSGCSVLGQTIKVEVPAYTEYHAYLAWYLAIESSETPTPTPSPDGDLKIGDTCPKCKGKGKIDGDSGGSMFDCWDCGGNGIIDEGDPIITPTQQPSAIIPATEEYYVIYANEKYVYNNNERKFINPITNSKISPNPDVHPSEMDNISICDGNTCRQYPVLQRTVIKPKG